MNTQMTEKHALRLLKLAAFLRKVRTKELDMGSWWEQRCDTEGNECGTSACALGWAGRIPGFRRLGLKSELGLYGGTVTFRPTRVFDREFAEEVDRLRGSGERNGNGDYETYTAAERFFGLTPEEANTLFTPANGHRTPAEVARNIRAVVKKHFPKLRLSTHRRQAA